MTATNKELSPTKVIDYINDNTTVFLAIPVYNGMVQHKVERAAYQDKSYYFLTPDGIYQIEDSRLENKPLEVDDRIYIHAEEGSWSLYKGFDFNLYSDHEMYKMLEPDEIRECIRRGREIEAFINMKVAFKDKDGNFLNVSVHLEVRLETDDYDLENPDSYLAYNYLFQVFLNNTICSTFVKDIWLPLEMTNEKAVDWVLFNIYRDHPTIKVSNRI